MNAKYIFIFCSFLTGFANSASTYDQRQTGDLNVQVDLKDLRIIALMKGSKEEYVDYDYAYDYSEMTIKPQNGTTPKPSNGTSTTADTIKVNTTSADVVTEQTTFEIKNNNSQSLETTEVTSYLNNDSTTTVKSLEMITPAVPELPGASSTKFMTYTSTIPPLSSSTTAAGCKKGFVMNHKGDCELKLQSAGNALLKLVKLSQKLKLRRENRRNAAPK